MLDLKAFHILKQFKRIFPNIFPIAKILCAAKLGCGKYICAVSPGLTGGFSANVVFAIASTTF